MKAYTPFDADAVNGLSKIYHEHFSKNNCQRFLNLFNRFSIADAILQSGNTSILIEFKRRTGSLSAYPTVILEKLKYDSSNRLQHCLAHLHFISQSMMMGY